MAGTIFFGLTDGEIVNVNAINYVLFDPRGWVLSCRQEGGTLLFEAGCHSFSETEAIAHWGDECYADPARGRQFVEAVGKIKDAWLKNQSPSVPPEGTEGVSSGNDCQITRRSSERD
jgi:hypothetical protein